MKINMTAYTVVLLSTIAITFVDPGKTDTFILIGCLFFLARIADKLYEKLR